MYSTQQRLEESENRCTQRIDELKASKEKEQQLTVQLHGAEEEVARHERRVQEEEEARIAAAEAPPPPQPEEVQREMMRAFDTAAAAICTELAARTGTDAPMDVDVPTGGGSFVVGQDGLDADAMIEAGVPVATMAEQYLRAVTERAERAFEGSVQDAVEKWRKELKKRRTLQDQLQELKGSIRVMCRVRPAGADEGESAVSTTNDSDLAITTHPGKDGRKNFAFDHVFGPQSKQASVFEEVEPVLDSVLSGFNVCIFAYGQTGSGKTFTMDGKRTDEDLVGINPRALRGLFNLIREKQQLAAMSTSGEDGWSYEVNVSYLEIYNENLRDLLQQNAASHGEKERETRSKRPSKTLEIRQVENAAVSVPGLTSIAVSNADEVEAALVRGSKHRSVRGTQSNSESSRSHSIVMVTVTGRNALSGASTHGKLHLVDLAGSERVKKSEVTGQGMAEACNINKSLSSLGDVMAALQEKSKHIPFRNSKLTQLLADSLGGNSKTFMFVNINPTTGASAESLCSLNFAARVRRVELGKASAKSTQGASLQELKAAKDSEERANNELGAANTRLGELEREAHLAAEAQSALAAELASARKAASESKETAAVIMQSEVEHQRHEVEQQRLELAEERKKGAVLEAKLREMNGKLVAAEKAGAEAREAGWQALAPVAAPVSAPVAAPSARAPSARAPSAAPVAAPSAAPSAAPLPAPTAIKRTQLTATRSSARAAPAAAPAASAPVAFAEPSPADAELLIPPTPVAPAPTSSVMAPDLEPLADAPSAPQVSSIPQISMAPVTVVPEQKSRRPSLLNAAGSLVGAAASKAANVLGLGGNNLMDAPNIMDAPIMSSTPLKPTVAAGSMIPAPSIPAPSAAPAAPAAFVSASEANAMDADAMFAAAEAMAASESPGMRKRRSGGSARGGAAAEDSRRASVAPGSTPSKMSKWTPSKLARPDNAESVRSAKKVQFNIAAPQPNFDDSEESRAADMEAGDSFPLFSLPTEKENGTTALNTAAPSPAKKQFNSLTEAVRFGSSLTKSDTEVSKRFGSANGGMLGGAARVVVSGKPKRSVSQRQTVGGTGSSAIGKPRENKGLRRMSLATQQAVESAASLRPRRTMWE